MFRAPDCYHRISMSLSAVLDEIGVNEQMVLKKRKTVLLTETLVRVRQTLLGEHATDFFLGSQSEGTTTKGLNSDVDILVCLNLNQVIQDMSDWTPHLWNSLLIEDENIPSGYCFLQELRSDAPLPANHEFYNLVVKETKGRVILNNSILAAILFRNQQRQGPAQVSEGRPGLLDNDKVLAFPVIGLPKATTGWEKGLEYSQWPTATMKAYIKKCKCFVVAVGSKSSENGSSEWRLSTSLAERCLVFNLNITQIRCYILMKMFLKSYVKPRYGGVISSFMCKTVLFHCIKSKEHTIWHEHNLLKCLTFCVLTLHNCVSCGNCPHFFMKKNNLMAGKIPHETRFSLLQLISNWIKFLPTALFEITIDNLGNRLLSTLHPSLHTRISESADITGLLTIGDLYTTVARYVSQQHMLILHVTHKDTLEISIGFLFKALVNLSENYRNDTGLEKIACKLLAPLVCTSLGSLVAAQDIFLKGPVSEKALAYLRTGVKSDTASSQLKFASVLYCSGKYEEAESVLRDIEEHYNKEVISCICGCYPYGVHMLKKQFCEKAKRFDVEVIRQISAFCVKFLPSEINCTPHELRYELFRPTDNTMHTRGFHDEWMDLAAVDALPYLYFLQYKTFGRLKKTHEQQRALRGLVSTIVKEINLGHKETALNLAGQCMVLENKYADALQFYKWSLNLRRTNNVASILICVLLTQLINR